MALPPLRIPISVPTDALKQDMQKAIDVTRTATRQIVSQFVSMNREALASTTSVAAIIAREWSQVTAKQIAGSLAWKVAMVGAAFGIIQAIGGVINMTREQLKEVLDFADKANKAGVEPQFFQSWLAGARNLKISMTDLEDAIKHAFDQTKIAVNPDWTVWEEGKAKINSVEKALLEVRELFSTTQKFTGLDLFRDATSQEGKARAVLVSMLELETIGERLISLDLAEKMFGAKFADNIRQGNTSAAEMLSTIDKLKDGGQGIWSGRLVEESKEIDRKLKEAHDTLDREMKPQFENLVSLANDLKSIWADIIGLIARGAELLNTFVGTNKQETEEEAERREAMTSLFVPGGEAIAEASRRRRRRGTLAQDAGLDDIGRPFTAPSPAAVEAGVNDLTGPVLDRRGNIPLPRRRPADAPKTEKKEAEEETADAFDKATEAINRSIAALHADAAAVGQSQAAHTQLRAELRLLEAARQAGTEVTDEQIKKYAELRREMGAEQALAAAGIKLGEDNAETFTKLSATIRAVAESLEAKKRAFQGVQDAVRFGGNEIISFIDRASEKGAKFGDLMADVFRSIAREALKAALTGEGAFAKLFGLSGQGGGVGGLGGLVAGLFGGGGANPAVEGATNIVGIAGNVPVPTFMAEGGTIPPGGLAYVGEHGPNARMIRAGAEPVTVTPADLASPARGGDVLMSFSLGNIDARGAQQGVSEEIVRGLERRLLPAAVTAVKQAMLQRRF